MRVRSGTRGFTLVELMAVIVILGVLLALAISTIRPSRGGGGAIGYARKVVSAIEDMRLRTIATRRWQRLRVVSSTGLIHEESVDTGMATPTSWREVRDMTTPRGVTICGFEAALRLTPNGCPTSSLSGELKIAPDGIGSTAATFYIQDVKRTDEKYRVTVYRATGMPQLFNEH
jgi:prepilin-type N-terminal cleavage/methylation domain-containing protein